MAIITPALGAARASLNKRFPDRDHASDGWIGNLAHQGEMSGHNPDETGNAEYQDADNLDEVRAVDLDADLRHPTLTMQHVVDAILRTPADRDRCSYIIYNRRIWSRSAGYVPRQYTGINPHTSHAHLSGRPVNDADDRPWSSIERLGIEEDLVADVQDARVLFRSDGVVDAPRLSPTGRTKTKTEMDENKLWAAGSYLQHTYEQTGRLRGSTSSALARIEATLAVLAGQDPVAAIREEFVKLKAEFLEDVEMVIREEIPDTDADRLTTALRRLFSEIPDEEVPTT